MTSAIFAKERPDALLPTMGGQTALNCALDLWRHGVLEKYKGRSLAMIFSTVCQVMGSM